MSLSARNPELEIVSDPESDARTASPGIPRLSDLAEWATTGGDGFQRFIVVMQSGRANEPKSMLNDSR